MSTSTRTYWYDRRSGAVYVLGRLITESQQQVATTADHVLSPDQAAQPDGQRAEFGSVTAVKPLSIR